MKQRSADLHLHTNHSDGTFTPEEVVRRAEEKGLTVISITDHDSVGGIEAARKAAAGRIEILPGVEMTAAFGRREIHILGYGIHFEDPSWVDFLDGLQRRRVDRIQAMIERLQPHGISITLEEVQKISGGGSLGRPHLAEILLQKGAVRSFDEAFQRYLGDNAPCFVKTVDLTVQETVRRIHHAGGVAVCAHPYRIVDDAWIPELIEDGIQGIEVHHSEQTGAVAEKYRRIASKEDLLMTGGSDCHGFRKSKGPLIGTVTISYEWVDRLKEAISAVRSEPVDR